MSGFIYCFLRKDIEPVQQIIQLGHVTFEAGRYFGRDFDIPSMCLFEVADEKELFRVRKYLNKHNIMFEMFYEPDNNIGFSAICTRIINTEDEMSLFSEFTLFNSTKT